MLLATAFLLEPKNHRTQAVSLTRFKTEMPCVSRRAEGASQPELENFRIALNGNPTNAIEDGGNRIAAPATSHSGDD
jgi:hypothetical protein